MAGRSSNKKSESGSNGDVSAGAPAAHSGRFAYDKLERVIHEKARLGIMSSLATHPDGLLFSDLKDLCSLTDGNLSRHLQLLQESKLVEVWKGFKNNRPQTLVRLTDDGKKRFLEYVQELEQVVADAMAATGRAAPARLPLSKGFSPDLTAS